jgi:zinc transport system permease protein
MPEILALGFMRHAFIMGLMVGTVLAVMSFFVVLRGLSFIGVGISHAAFGGLALGVLIGVAPFWTAVLFCVVVANLITLTGRRGRLGEDASIGIFFSLSMAAGVILLGLSRTYTTDLFGYLFGSILAITPADMAVTAVAGGGVLLLVGAFFKELLLDSFDREVAAASGLPAPFLEHLLVTCLALAVVTAIKMVGVVLAEALLVIPAAAAFRLSGSWRGMLAGSVAVSLVSVVGGFTAAYYLDLAPGACITVLAAAIFFLTFLKPR